MYFGEFSFLDFPFFFSPFVFSRVVKVVACSSVTAHNHWTLSTTHVLCAEGKTSLLLFIVKPHFLPFILLSFTIYFSTVTFLVFHQAVVHSFTFIDFFFFQLYLSLPSLYSNVSTLPPSFPSAYLPLFFHSFFLSLSIHPRNPHFLS